MNKKIQCPYCFEKFFLSIYPEDGEEQSFTYDCEVCCHPIELDVAWDAEDQRLTVNAMKSNGFE